MSKLDDWVTIHYKEDSIPSLRSGPLTNESKKWIKGIFIELIGEDETRPIAGPQRNGIEQGLRRTRNKLRNEFRQKVEEL